MVLIPKEPKEHVERRANILVAYILTFVLLGMPLWLYTTSVERSPLPTMRWPTTTAPSRRSCTSRCLWSSRALILIRPRILRPNWPSNWRPRTSTAGVSFRPPKASRSTLPKQTRPPTQSTPRARISRSRHPRTISSRPPWHLSCLSTNPRFRTFCGSWVETSPRTILPSSTRPSTTSRSRCSTAEAFLYPGTFSRL